MQYYCRQLHCLRLVYSHIKLDSVTDYFYRQTAVNCTHRHEMTLRCALQWPNFVVLRFEAYIQISVELDSTLSVEAEPRHRHFSDHYTLPEAITGVSYNNRNDCSQFCHSPVDYRRCRLNPLRCNFVFVAALLTVVYHLFGRVTWMQDSVIIIFVFCACSLSLWSWHSSRWQNVVVVNSFLAIVYLYVRCAKLCRKSIIVNGTMVAVALLIIIKKLS